MHQPVGRLQGGAGSQRQLKLPGPIFRVELQPGDAGGLQPIAYTLVQRAFPEDRRPTMYAILSAGWVLPNSRSYRGSRAPPGRSA